MSKELFTAERWVEPLKVEHTGRFNVISNEKRIYAKRVSLFSLIKRGKCEFREAVEIFENLLDELDDLENKDKIMQGFLAELEEQFHTKVQAVN